MAAPKGLSIKQMGGNLKREETGKATEDYEKYFSAKGGTDGQRTSNYTDVVNKYYDLATSFYEYGWGESFHFAHRFKWETLRESVLRHEYYLALKMGLKPGMKVLDVGCGIGGPLRNIAAYTGAHVTGLNNNAYQVSRGEELNRATGHHDTCGFVKADFMNIPAEDATYDAVYEIEATCHAPDAQACYAEIFRVLKPGGVFGSYEWCLTDEYDPTNEEHKQIAQDICLGNGLPTTRTTREVLAALKGAGFEVEEAVDLAPLADIPWYEPIDPFRPPGWSWVSNFKTTQIGRNITHYLVWGLETVGIAPKGSMRVSGFLKKGADALVEGGRKGIYTAMYFTVARKPL
mmetsp:Transcript_18115/g.61698  ORF Transcript_18115/g.61698 Transcript_18115/m.61698 type:complete len:346 (-) Transcript_18115:1032-2069(-)